MKRTILCILFLGFFVNLFATEFTFDLSKRTVSVQNNNGIAEFDWSNAASVDIPGDPSMPVYVVDFILPDDADMDSLSVETDPLSDILTGKFDVLPAAPIEPENSEHYWPVHPENIDENGRNRLIYGGNGIEAFNGFLHNNDNWIAKIVPSKWKSVKFVKVFVRAYDWNPATKELKKLNGGTLTVSVNSSKNTIALSHFSPSSAWNLGNLMQNMVNQEHIRIQNLNSLGNSSLYSYIKGQTTFSALSASEKQHDTLYIITTNQIKNASKMFKRFIDSKINRDFDVYIVTEEDTWIYKGDSYRWIYYGWKNENISQKADLIRNYLTHNNRYYDIDYLLLIGDPHPGSCKAAPAFNDPRIMNINDRQSDCVYDGTNEGGDIPMKWINLDAYSKNEELYCKGYDDITKKCDGTWMKEDDLRRAIPSDIYYSALSKDWDSNKNGLIGDGKKEIGTISNDVMLGRIPVYNNNIADLDRYFQKVIRYENTLKTYIPPTTANNVQNTNRDTIETLRHNIFAMANYMDNNTDSDETPNWIFSDYLNNLPVNHSFNFDFMFRNDDLLNWTYPKGFKGCKNNGNFKTLVDKDNGNGECVVNKFYQQFFPSNLNNVIINNPGNSGWSNGNAADAWRDGKYGIVLWSSHGNRRGAVINTNDVSNDLEDYYPVHTFQASCQTGWPEDPDNLAASLLKHGAVTTIAASRNAWGYRTKFKKDTFKLVSEDSRKRSSQELTLLYLQRFLLNNSAGRSFSIAIENFSEENEFKRNEIVFNLYGDPTLGITSWRGHGEDSDKDGIVDDFDNCPNKSNPDQLDSDLDGIGNECDICPGFLDWQDFDNDGFPDECDNCKYKWNPLQLDSDKDGIGDECDKCPNHPNPEQEDRDGDGVGDICDNCADKYLNSTIIMLGKYNPREINNSEIVVACDTNGDGGALCKGLDVFKDEQGNYWWQPDHDFDGTGDACDKDYISWSEFSGIPTGTSVENGITYQDKNSKVVSMRRNETLSVGINMLKPDLAQTSTETATTRYCWITTDEFDRGVWGTDGHCTTEAGHTKGACETNFGYSHGSDPEPVNDRGEESWKFIKDKTNSTTSDEFTDIETGSSETVDWDWRYDFKEDNPLDVGTSLDTAPECTNFSLGVCQDANVPRFYYTMSTGVHGTASDYIILNPVTKNNEINPNFFKNKEKYARSSRLTLNPVVITYHTEPFIIFAPIEYCSGRCDFILEEYQEMIVNELINGPRPYEMPGMDHYFKNDYGSDLINRGVSFREWSNNAAGMPSVSEKNRPMYLATISKNAGGTNVGLVAKSNDATQLRDMKASSGVTFEIAEMDQNSNGDWRTKGILEDVPAGFAPTASVYHNGNLYVVSNGEKETQVYEIKSTGQTVMPEDGYNICFHPVKIVNPIQIGTLPNNLSGITLHSVGNSLMALGKGGNGMEVYKFSKKGFENITGANSPQIRDIYNVEVKDGVLYLAGGAELGKDSVDLKTDFWSFTETDGWQIVRDDLNLFPLTLRIDFDGDKIILTNRAIRHNATTERAIFNADGSGEITLETIKVEGAPVQKYEESFCISENDNVIFPGITNFYGECVKVENYDFNEVTFPDYKLSVAGYRNSLYLGGLSGIRRVEIGENGEITKKEMIYSGESNNLAVYGNTLYAANYSEIDIFEIAEDGSIERKSSVKTNNCKNIRIESNKLFAAENKRVRIFDLSNPLSPEPLKTINLGNKAEDLEITENQLFVYENLSGLFTRKGKVSVFDISNIENPQKKSEFSQYCNDPEMQKRFDNAQRPGNSVYLGCKNGTFKVTESGLQKMNGSKNYLREGYVFDGVLYQVFSGTLHLSSLKTEEIQEDGWL